MVWHRGEDGGDGGGRRERGIEGVFDDRGCLHKGNKLRFAMSSSSASQSSSQHWDLAMTGLDSSMAYRTQPNSRLSTPASYLTPNETNLHFAGMEPSINNLCGRSASSPPSPVFSLPLKRFIATASVECASIEIEL